MTVAELIAQLEKMPADALVVMYMDDEDGWCSPIGDVEAQHYGGGEDMGQRFQEGHEEVPQDAVPCVLLSPRDHP